MSHTKPHSPSPTQPPTATSTSTATSPTTLAPTTSHHRRNSSGGGGSGATSPTNKHASVAPSSLSTKSGKHDYLMKLIMIGDSGVGKSCLLIRFSEDTFTHSFISTVGIDFKVRTIQLDDKAIKLQIYDTAGQDRFRTITAAGSHGVLLVYDVTDERTFLNIRSWVAGMPPSTESAVKLVIGNKCDLEEKRVITVERGKQMAREFGYNFVETSAKTNMNVELAFLTIVQEIKSRMDQNKLNVEKAEGNVDVTESQQGKKCAC